MGCALPLIAIYLYTKSYLNATGSFKVICRTRSQTDGQSVNFGEHKQSGILYDYDIVHIPIFITFLGYLWGFFGVPMVFLCIRNQEILNILKSFDLGWMALTNLIWIRWPWPWKRWIYLWHIYSTNRPTLWQKTEQTLLLVDHHSGNLLWPWPC